MSEEITLQQAMDALRKQFGEGITAGRAEGRDIMADALRAELGIAPPRAKAIVQDLEAAHSIKWSERQTERGRNEPAPVAGVLGTAGTPAAPVLTDLHLEGYWRF